MSTLTLLICAACFPLCWLGRVWLASFRPVHREREVPEIPATVSREKAWRYQQGWGSRPL